MTTEYLLDKEVEHVLAALMPQNALIFRVILRTGARVGDVVSLKTDRLKPSFWYIEQKTGKPRRMGLGEDLCRQIKAQAGPVWAFPSARTDGHKTRQAVWADLKRAERAFRLPVNVGTHSGRKVYAVHMLEKYGDVKKVQKCLNHSNPGITAIYAMADRLLDAKLAAKKKGVSGVKTPDVDQNSTTHR